MFIVNVEGAILKDNKWLIIRRGLNEEHAPGGLSLVGGKVEEETTYDILEKTLKREIFEEVGIHIKDNTQYVYSSSFITDDQLYRVVNIVFLCEYDYGEAFINSPDEVAEIMWLTTEEILQRDDIAPWLRESIERAEKLLQVKN